MSSQHRKGDRARSRRGHSPSPVANPGTPHALSDQETRERLRPHLAVLGAVYAEAIGRGVRDPFLFVCNHDRGTPYRVVGMATADATQGLARMIRRVSGGDHLAIVLVDGSEVGVIGFVARDCTTMQPWVPPSTPPWRRPLRRGGPEKN